MNLIELITKASCKKYTSIGVFSYSSPPSPPCPLAEGKWKENYTKINTNLFETTETIGYMK